MKFEAVVDEEPIALDFDTEQQQVTIDGETQRYEFMRQENGRYLLRMGTRLYKIDNVGFKKKTVTFTLNGQWCTVPVRNEQDLLLDRLGLKTSDELGEGQLHAPMPGKILELMVSEGDEVDLDEPVAILEAMKMENELKAPVAGVIKSIQVQKDQSVEKNELILEIESSG